VSTSRFVAILFFSVSLCTPVSYAQRPYPQMPQSADGGPPSELHPAFDPFGRKLHSDFVPTISPAPDWPAASEPRPVSDVVSLHDLQHPVSKKVLEAAFEAQQFSKAHQTDKAIAKLEKALRLDPQYRDGHCNLGVQYAHAGRLQEARTEFNKALEIGPPSALIYADLALASAAAGEFQEANENAWKALELDPDNPAAQRIVQLYFH
jgi:tetratricopeptide (TPR) repeat protein